MAVVAGADVSVFGAAGAGTGAGAVGAAALVVAPPPEGVSPRGGLSQEDSPAAIVAASVRFRSCFFIFSLKMEGK